ncbi:MAG: hypothetical protein KGQ59_09075 [Bdellovibrionales bacterium]|nr:hypothetical protein [Bdellovibrionales bacterium]
MKKLKLQSISGASFSSRAVLFLYLFSASFSLFLIWNHLNYIQMDLAGHLSSGAWFQRGYFHQYQDANFLGYVHGLFYPPLEDFLISVFRTLLPRSPVVGFQLYFSFLTCGLLTSLFLLGSAFRSPASRHLTRILLLLVFWLSKYDGMYFQGLSLEDLLVTGLSSQILGGIFFFLFLKEWIRGLRPFPTTVLLTLIILSHIVVSLVSLMILALYFVLTRESRKRIAFAVIASFLLSAFYLIPFLAYKSQLTTSTIYIGDVWQLSLMVLILLGLFFRQLSNLARVLLVTSFLLTVVNVLGHWAPALQEFFPRFHYYRLSIFALYLGVLGYSMLWDEAYRSSWPAKAHQQFRVVSVVFAVALLVRFSVFIPELGGPKFQASRVEFKDLGPTQFEDYGRYWVIGSQRSADFGIDSFLQVQNPEFRSLKGLYWESSRNNLALSSYLATLLSSPVVLDHYFYWGYDCEAHRCLLDHFFRDYNVKGLMIEKEATLKYLSSERRQCFQELLKKGETKLYRLQPKGSFSVQGTEFSNFWLESKAREKIFENETNRVVELVSPANLIPYNRSDPQAFSNFMKSIFMHCQTGRMSRATFVDSKQLPQLRKEWVTRTGDASTESSEALAGAQNRELQWTREAPGRFRIHVPGDQDQLIKIKLNYFPLLKLSRTDGSQVRLYDGFPSILAIAHGDLLLEFKKSALLYFSYGLSVLVFLVFAVFWRPIQTKLGLRP